MFTIDLYLPTRIVFGPGRLNELRNMKLPGKRALICVTADGLMTALGILPKVQEMLQENGVYLSLIHILKTPGGED